MSRASYRRKHGLQRHPIIGQDSRTAMHRFLDQCNCRNGVEIYHHQQWKTFGAALRLGYITDLSAPLTEKGLQELDRLNKHTK
jgi:hypothetical protein